MKKGVDYIGVCCVFFCHDGKGNFLLNKRSNKCRDEIGRWDSGGGALEFGETPEEGVRREIKEEYGADVVTLKFAGVRNVVRQNNQEKTHWIALVFSAQLKRDQAYLADSHSMDEIGWFKPEEFPSDRHSQINASFEVVKQTGLL